MADVITIKALQDASLDAKSLEEVVNGNDTKQVTTRLGENYPTLQKAIKELFENGGIAGRFKTLAELQASPLVDGDYALVADDADDKNGIYIKESSVWVKSKYDTARLFNAIKEKIGTNLVEFVDVDDTPYAHFNSAAQFYLSGLNLSVQDLLKLLDKSNSTDLIDVRDKDGKSTFIQTQDGTVIAPNFITKSANLNDIAEKLKTIATDIKSSAKSVPSFGVVYEHTDGARVHSHAKTNKKLELVNATELPNNYKSVWSPCIGRVSKAKFYMAFGARETGLDYDPIYIAGRTLEYNPDTQEFTKGDIQTLAINGTTADGIPYSYLNPNITIVETGNNAGRILVHFNYMTNPSEGIGVIRDYKPFYVYSDDGGANFSDPIDLTPQFDFSGLDDTAMIFGTGHGIQKRYGEHKGRLIIPCYTRNPKEAGSLASRVIYSDDGGATFEMGNAITNTWRLNECQAAELEDGSIYMVMRQHSRLDVKYQAYSYDGGQTFTEFSEMEVKGAGIKNGLLQASNIYDHSLPKLFLLSPHDNTNDKLAENRSNATIWVSYDGGKTYPYKTQIADGICQYSDMQALDPDHILAAYGGGSLYQGNVIYGHILNLNTLIGDK